MKGLRVTTAAVLTAALLLLGSGAAMADDACVWSHELQRWICVPP